MSFFFPVLGSKDVLFSAAIPLVSINVTVGTLFCIFVVLVISALHCIGVRQGTVTQNILTVIKIGSLVGIILLGIFVGKGSTAHFSPLFDWDKITKSSVFASAFIPAIFAYSGWNAVIYIAGEVRDPERNLPKALLIGNLIVIVLYLAMGSITYLPISLVRALKVLETARFVLVILLVLLPVAMTMTLIWKIKEVIFVEVLSFRCFSHSYAGPHRLRPFGSRRGGSGDGQRK